MGQKAWYSFYEKKVPIDLMFNDYIDEQPAKMLERDLLPKYYKEIMEVIKNDGFNPYPSGTYHTDAFKQWPCMAYCNNPNYSFTEQKKYRIIPSHRYMMLKKLAKETKITEASIFIDDQDPNIATKDEFEKLLDDPKVKGHSNQKITLPYNLILEGRDDISQLLFNTILPSFFWFGKTILDVACNAGGWSLECLHYAAKSVIGFDKDPLPIYIANYLTKLFRYEDRAKFIHSDFSGIDWKNIPKSDVAFINQCIYSIPEGEKVLDIIADKCDTIVMFTWTADKKPYVIDYNGGFRPTWTPTVMDVKEKLVSVGFKHVFLSLPTANADNFLKNQLCLGGSKINFIATKSMDDSQFYFVPESTYKIVQLAPDLKIFANNIPAENHYAKLYGRPSIKYK